MASKRGGIARPEVEREELELNGEVMTPGEKIRSTGREAEHDVLADVDRAKRAIRENPYKHYKERATGASGWTSVEKQGRSSRV